MSLASFKVSQALENFESEYQEVISQRDKARAEVNKLFLALQFIADNNPETPQEYTNIRSVARKAINECD